MHSQAVLGDCTTEPRVIGSYNECFWNQHFIGVTLSLCIFFLGDYLPGKTGDFVGDFAGDCYTDKRIER